MGGNKKISDNLIAVFICNFTNRLEITKGLAHFNIINVNIAIVHPISCKCAAVSTFALSNLIFMMRENQVLTAAVNINCLTKIAPVHSRTLDMPAGSSLAPRRIPVRLPFLGGFPKCEIKRIFFLLTYGDSCT